MRHQVGPLYYLSGQFSKFVRPRHVRIETHSSSRDLLVTAYKSGSQLVIVAINEGQEDRSADMMVTEAAALFLFSLVRTTVQEFWKELEPDRDGYIDLLRGTPAQGVTMFRGGSVDSFGSLSGLAMKMNKP
mgnify:CR=1 FL=1